jgi:hypothetical protein
MRIHLTAAFAVLASLANPAFADVQSFEFAFVEACFKPLPDLTGVPAFLAENGWEAVKGADEGEFEYGDGSTMIFLKAVKVSESPGCTVMNADVPVFAAQWLLELALEKHFPGAWEKSDDPSSQTVWRLNTGNATTNIYINDGLGGGAGISLTVHE